MRLLARALLTLAFALVAGLANAQQTIGPPALVCNQITQGTATGRIVAAATGKNIVVCGWDVNANVAAGAFTLAYGTGGTCASNVTTIVAYTALPVGAFIDHPPYAFSTAPTTAPGGSPPNTQTDLCVNAATTVSYTIFWAQF